MVKILSVIMALFISTAHADEWRPIYGGDAGSGFVRNELAFTTGSSTSVTGAVGSGVDIVRLSCSVRCYIAIAASGSAALIATEATGVQLNADSAEYFRTRKGETIAVIGPDGAGDLAVHEMSR